MSSLLSPLLVLVLLAQSVGESPAVGPPKSGGVGPHAITCGANKELINGIELAYLVAGAGPMLVCPTPGDGMDSLLYRRTLGRLEEIFTTVYLDTRGTGRSEEPADRSAYELNDFVADIEAIRTRLGQDQIWIFGHDKAGQMAIRYAATRPKHCAGLILVGTRPDESEEWDEYHRRRAVTRVEELRNEDPTFQEYATTICTPGSDEEVKKTHLDCLGLNFATVSGFKKNRSLFEQCAYSLAAYCGIRRCQKTWNVAEDLVQVRCPTVIIVGAQDVSASPREAQRLHLTIRCSKLIVLEESGHYPWLEEPERFFSLLREATRVLEK